MDTTGPCKDEQPFQTVACPETTEQLIVKAKKASEDSRDPENLKVSKTPLFFVKDVESARHFVASGVDVNTVYKYNNEICLHSEKSLEVTKFLVEAGANVNAKDSCGFTPLFFTKNIDTFKYLVSKGAEIKVNSSVGRTHLHKPNSLELTKYLVEEQGLDVNAPFLLRFPLNFVRDVETAKYLVSKGVNMEMMKVIANMFHSLESVELAEYYVSLGFDPKKCSGRDLSPFSTVRSLEMAVFFIKNGCDVNQESMDGYTPLHNACLVGDIKLVKYLISQGAKIKDSMIMDTKNHEILKLLIDGGADVNALKGKDKMSALHEACGYRNLTKVKFLVEHGADLKVKDRLGRTPLFYAVRMGQKELVDYLIEKGADFTVKDNNGDSALHYAKGPSVAMTMLEKISGMIPEDIFTL